MFITAFRPTGSGIPNVIGWGGSAGGWSRAGQLKWSNLSEVQGFVTDSDIYALIAAVKPAGTRAWVKILNAPAPPDYLTDDSGNILTDDSGNPLLAA
jgi:hypothetical protein